MRSSVTRKNSIFTIILLVLTPIVHSAHISAPKGSVLLTISGNLKHPNVGDEVLFDRPTLESLPSTQFTTQTPWHEGPQNFTGVRLNVLLAAIGSEATRMVAIGVDDYQFTLEQMDFERYPIIIAYRENGCNISVRNLGPLRIMMPFDDYVELLTPLNESRSVWQLVKLELL